MLFAKTSQQYFYISSHTATTWLSESSFIAMVDADSLCDGCKADIKPVLLCPGGIASVSVHQIFSLICYLLHLSVGPALICAADGRKGPQTEREWNPCCIEGWEQKICHSPLVSCFNSLNSSSGGYRLLSPIHSFTPYCSSTGYYQIQIQLFSFPFIVKTWEWLVLKRLLCTNSKWLLMLGGAIKVVVKLRESSLFPHH